MTFLVLRKKIIFSKNGNEKFNGTINLSCVVRIIAEGDGAILLPKIDDAFSISPLAQHRRKLIRPWANRSSRQRKEGRKVEQMKSWTFDKEAGAGGSDGRTLPPAAATDNRKRKRGRKGHIIPKRN